MARFLVAVALALLAACGRPEAVAAIRQQIDEAVEAAEAGDLDPLFALLDEDFHGNPGWDRAALRRLLTALRLRHARVEIAVLALDIEPDPGDPQAADMRGRFLLAGLRGLLPEDGRLIEVEGRWRRDGGDWRLVRARWR